MITSSTSSIKLVSMSILLYLVLVVVVVTVHSYSLVPVLKSSSISKPIRSTSQLVSLSSTSTNIYTLDGKEIRGPITPNSNYIIVKLKDTLQATMGGILLPDQSKERPTEGIVIESGLGKLHPYTGVRIVNPIQKGCNVLFGKYDGTPINYNNEDCQIIRDDNVLLSYTGVTMRYDTVTPIRDYVLIQLKENNDNNDTDNDTESEATDTGISGYKTKSGIVLANTIMKDLLPCCGIVMKVGEGRMASLGQLTSSPVSVGDFVKFKDYSGNDIVIEGINYSIVKMIDILCTQNKKQK